MAKRIQAKEVRQFLRERNLTGSYNKWAAIRKRRKVIVDVARSNYDGTSSRGKVYVYRDRGKTIFRDFLTLNIIGKSRLGVKNAIKKAFTYDRKLNEFKVRGWDVKFGYKESQLKLKNVSRMQSYNSALQRTRTIERTNRIRMKSMGMVVCDLTYVSGNGNRKRVIIRSRADFLGSKAMRSRLIDENIQNGSGLAGFSPVDIIINGVWFEYWSDKNEKLERIR